MVAAWHGSGRQSHSLVVVVVAVTSQWQSCHVTVAAWYDGGGRSHGLVMVAAVAAVMWQQWR